MPRLCQLADALEQSLHVLRPTPVHHTAESCMSRGMIRILGLVTEITKNNSPSQVVVLREHIGSQNVSNGYCMVITYRKGKDQPGKVANPARGELNREN